MVKNWSEIESYLVRYLFRKKKPRDIHTISHSERQKPLLIFGSGSSINDITNSEWQYISQNFDTLGFNHFYHCTCVKPTYYLIREFETLKFFKYFSSIFNLNSFLRLRRIFQEDRFKNTKFIFRYDRKAGSSIVLHSLIRKKINVFCSYENDLNYSNFTRLFENKIPHGIGTLIDAVHIAKLLGYKRIVFAGVDLYDRRYFYLGKDETRLTDVKRGKSHFDRHNTLHILDQLPVISREFERENVVFYNVNPRSLLRDLIGFSTIYDIVPVKQSDA